MTLAHTRKKYLRIVLIDVCIADRIISVAGRRARFSSNLDFYCVLFITRDSLTCSRITRARHLSDESFNDLNVKMKLLK